MPKRMDPDKVWRREGGDATGAKRVGWVKCGGGSLFSLGTAVPIAEFLCDASASMYFSVNCYSFLIKSFLITFYVCKLWAAEAITYVFTTSSFPNVCPDVGIFIRLPWILAHHHHHHHHHHVLYVMLAERIKTLCSNSKTSEIIVYQTTSFVMEF